MPFLVFILPQLLLFSVAEAHPEARQQQPVSGRAVGGGQDGSHHAGVRGRPFPAVAAAQHDPGRLKLPQTWCPSRDLLLLLVLILLFLLLLSSLGPAALVPFPNPGCQSKVINTSALHLRIKTCDSPTEAHLSLYMSKQALLPMQTCSKMVPEKPLWTLHQRGWDGGCFLCVSHGEMSWYKMPYDSKWHWEPPWPVSLSWVCWCWTSWVMRWDICCSLVSRGTRWRATLSSQVARQSKSFVICAGEKWDLVIGKAAKLSKDCPWKLELSQMRQQQETWEQDWGGGVMLTQSSADWNVLCGGNRNGWGWCLGSWGWRNQKPDWGLVSTPSRAAALEHQRVLYLHPVRNTDMDPHVGGTGPALSSGSRCSCFHSDDRCLFIFLIIWWLNHFVSVVITKALAAHGRVGGVAGTNAVPAHGRVRGVPYTYRWHFLYVLVMFPLAWRLGFQH